MTSDPTDPTDPAERHAHLGHRTGTEPETEHRDGYASTDGDGARAPREPDRTERGEVDRHGDPEPSPDERPAADGADRRGTPPDRS